MYEAHKRQDPVPHRYAPAGLSQPRCGLCQQDANHELHRVGLANEIGADATQCPGCEQIWPIEMTVRMMRFVRPDGRVLENRRMRVCHACAGMPVDEWAMLALRRDRGWIGEDDYVRLVAELADKTATTAALRAPCEANTRFGPCTELAGHAGAHAHQAVKVQR